MISTILCKFIYEKNIITLMVYEYIQYHNRNKIAPTTITRAIKLR